jgi:hypothetical protein
MMIIRILFLLTAVAAMGVQTQSLTTTDMLQHARKRITRLSFLHRGGPNKRDIKDYKYNTSENDLTKAEGAKLQFSNIRWAMLASTRLHLLGKVCGVFLGFCSIGKLYKLVERTVGVVPMNNLMEPLWILAFEAFFWVIIPLIMYKGLTYRTIPTS